MTDEEKLSWYVDEVREAIRLDWANLASKNLTADKRKAIREHLQMCNSALKDLIERNRSASERSKLGNHQRLRRSSTN
jgi:Na+/phosphate symporter